MIGFLRGRVDEINVDSIVLDVNGVGYEIVISDPSKFSLYQETIVYTYLKLSENDVCLYGFILKEEKELFLKLISVKGIGPKSAISMLSKSSYSSIIEAIEVSNINYLKKLPGIGPKAAQQIILDLKGHLRVNESESIKDDPILKEVKAALKGFGFKVSEIDGVLKNIDYKELKLDEIIIKALQLLNKK